jgi:hypothetical protein
MPKKGVDLPAVEADVAGTSPAMTAEFNKSSTRVRSPALRGTMLANILLKKYSVDGVDYERREPGQEAWTVS